MKEASGQEGARRKKRRSRVRRRCGERERGEGPEASERGEGEWGSTSASDAAGAGRRPDREGGGSSRGGEGITRKVTPARRRR